MTVPPLVPTDAAFAVTGPEWQVGAPAAEAARPAEGFGRALADAVSGLGAAQETASAAARDLATGRTDDLTATVMAVERARLGMELASQVRTRLVEAAQDVLHTQV
jgi:flagellar hook-basal body complex protein FliE